MTKAERSKNLRYKRPALEELGFEFILDKLYDISAACDDVKWAIDGDDDVIINALDGDESEVYEFKMAFTVLSAESEQLLDTLNDKLDCYEVKQKTFDDCVVALIGDRFRTVGFDDYEEDYYSLTNYEQELAKTEAGKRIMRMTKAEMLSNIGQCLGIVLSFQNVQMKYEYLKATMDILRDENCSVLRTMEEIEQAYIEAANDEFREWGESTRRLNKLISELPDRMWVE